MTAKTKKNLRVAPATPARRRSKKRRGISKDDKLMQKVALAEFPPPGVPPVRSDREVASMVGIHPQAVGDLIKAAFQHGYVSAVHHVPFEAIKLTGLQDALRQRYGLQRVILVPGLPEMLEDLDGMQRRNVQTQIIQSMAHRVVEHLDALLADAAARREPFTLGVAWGRTMRLIAEHLFDTPRACITRNWRPCRSSASPASRRRSRPRPT